MERCWRKGQEKTDGERKRRKEGSGKLLEQQMEVDQGGGQGKPQGSLCCGAVTEGSRDVEKVCGRCKVLQESG